MAAAPQILIVDDEPNIRLMLRTALASAGYEIREARDGREALDAIQQHVPDAMILDLSMPVLDGMSVLRELKEAEPQRKPRIIVLTAYGSIPAAVKATRLGAMDFLEKPVLPDDLRKSLSAVLGEPIPSAPPEKPADDYYNDVLSRARKALRMAQYADADALLAKAAESNPKDAAYFNLLGVLYETQHQWRLATKMYGKAISADANYSPAQLNMRRLVQIRSGATSENPIVLGDEPDIWFARIPAEDSHE